CNASERCMMRQHESYVTHKSRLFGNRWSAANDGVRIAPEAHYGTTTRRDVPAGASCIQQRLPRYVSGQIDGLHYKASIAARGASDRNLYQGVLQTTAWHVAHDMSYRL